ncbi:MAG: porin [Planctomycetota bacterium]|nr:porin [Planctomycetota bacterium]
MILKNSLSAEWGLFYPPERVFRAGRNCIIITLTLLVIGYHPWGMAQVRPADSLSKGEDKGGGAGQPIINLQSAKFEVGGFIQTRATFETNDSDNRRGDDNDSFSLKRIRLEFKGNLTKEVGFFIAPEFRGTNTQLVQGYIHLTYKPLPKMFLGVFKTAPSLEFSQSGKTELETLERANIVTTISCREPGIKMQDNLLDGRFYYGMSITNGNGNNVHTNDNDHYFYASRVSYKVLDNLSLGPEKLTFHLGGSYGYSKDSGERANSLFDTKNILSIKPRGLRTIVGEEIRAVYGQASLQGEYITTVFNPSLTGVRNIRKDGYYVQGSYFIIPEKIRAVVKYETFDPDKEVSNYKDINWTTIGLTYFIKGHNLKVETNYIIKDEKKDDLRNNAVLVQVQVVF